MGVVVAVADYGAVGPAVPDGGRMQRAEDVGEAVPLEALCRRRSREDPAGSSVHQSGNLPRFDGGPTALLRWAAPCCVSRNTAP